MEMEYQPQGRVGDLNRLAHGKFGKLSDGEKLLLEKAPTGDPASCVLGPDGSAQQIRADLVGWLCTDEGARKRVHSRGIQLTGADITGFLDLSFAPIPFQLALQHCRLKDGMNLRRAELSQLDLQGSLVNGILGEGVIVKNNVVLGYGFAAVGEVRLLGAQIGESLDCESGTFTNPPHRDGAGSGVALFADRINVKGGVSLRRCVVNGAVRLLGAQIRGDLDCTGGTFTNPPQRDVAGSGVALSADGINVSGAVFISDGFIAKGEVRLLGAQIGGLLYCNGGTFTNPRREDVTGSGDALTALRITVKSWVSLESGFTADGTVSLHSAQVVGGFYCRTGNFQAATLDLRDASAGYLTDSGLNETGSVAGSGPTI